jgi:cytochrome c553
MNRLFMTCAALTATAFAAIAHAADASIHPGQAVYKKFNCASCHGDDAKTSTSPAYPVLAGQHADYLAHALKAYQRGVAGPGAANARTNPIMGAFASQLSASDIAAVAAWLTELPSDLGVRK